MAVGFLWIDLRCDLACVASLLESSLGFILIRAMFAKEKIVLSVGPFDLVITIIRITHFAQSLYSRAQLIEILSLFEKTFGICEGFLNSFRRHVLAGNICFRLR